MRRVLLPHQIDAEPPPADGVLREYSGHSMGTSWSVRLVAGPALPALQAGLQAQLDAVVAQMSHWEAESDLGRFNRAPAGSWQPLPAAFFDVLAFALEVAVATRGAYDPCAGALVNLWGFGPQGRFAAPGFAPPSAPQVAAALARHTQQRAAFKLDHVSRRALQPGGLQLDFSAVAKGYAVDRLAFFLQSQGVRHFLVEVGGELRGAGVKPDGQPWWVALEQVSDVAPDNGPAPLVLALHGLAVATSGDYRRYFHAPGAAASQRYSHTIDPRRAAPISNQLASVTVLHPQCMAADAWSTALTVLGPLDGLALAERHGLAARFVLRSATGLSEILSSALHAMLDDE
ncbi:MAG: FAD:protein FMN transferase [Sphingomonadaceae bacterium]